MNAKVIQHAKEDPSRRGGHGREDVLDLATVLSHDMPMPEKPERGPGQPAHRCGIVGKLVERKGRGKPVLKMKAGTRHDFVRLRTHGHDGNAAFQQPYRKFLEPGGIMTSLDPFGLDEHDRIIMHVHDLR